MTDRVVVVAAANEGYFQYLLELLHSFFSCGAGNKYDFAVLDVGLSPEQTKRLRGIGVCAIAQPPWPFQGLEDQPEWHKALYCRPFFPNYFGAWDYIVHLDADSWFQDSSAIDLAIAGAREDGFAVLPLLDRGHWQRPMAAKAVASAHWHRNCLDQFFGSEIAGQYQFHPLIAGGLFAGHRNAPHWAIWKEYLLQGLKRKIDPAVEQAALTMAIHCSSPRTHFLPGHCHWFSHLGAIGLDTSADKYVEPFQPHHPISVIGLSADSKNEPVLVKTIDGRGLSRLLRYGKLQQSYRVNVAIEGSTHAFDGMALPSFRNRVFEAVSGSGNVNFLQIGAMDGVAFDPIRAFVTRYGWRGILVEPIPDLMERLKNNYATNDGLVFAPVAIAESSGCRKMSRVRAGAVQEGVLPIWADGISSLTPERTPLCGKKLTPEQARLVDDHLDVIDVDCLDFDAFEKRYEIGSFDVLQIDTEGYDWNILRQIDLKRHSTLCVHMEICCLPPNEIDKALAYLRSMDFTCYAMEDGQDLLALRRDFGAVHFGVS